MPEFSTYRTSPVFWSGLHATFRVSFSRAAKPLGVRFPREECGLVSVQAVLKGGVRRRFFQSVCLGPRLIPLRAGRLTRRVAGRSPFARLQELLRPTLARALPNTLAAAKVGDTLLTA